jgi:hypothetical protein
MDPLKALRRKEERQDVIDRILTEYPLRILGTEELFYRVRVNLADPCDSKQYDSPPSRLAGSGRLDSPGRPVLYGSPDLEICVHEGRVTTEDEAFVATLVASQGLRLLDLSVSPDASSQTEGLDSAVHRIFLMGKRAYPITRALADAARAAEFDGMIYPSRFSSPRRISRRRQLASAKSRFNLALFGRPITEGRVTASCLHRLILSPGTHDFELCPLGRS